MIRKAEEKDVPRLADLLCQVLEVHAAARPDIFISGTRKYQDNEILALIHDENKPIFVYEDEQKMVQGYVFCEFQYSPDVAVLKKRKMLFIDDLCVDSAARGQKIGEKLYQFALDFAKENGYDGLTLYVWNDNQGALRFYERLGMTPMKTLLEARF